MTKAFMHAWYYRLSYADNNFSVYLNERLIGTIQKASSGRWPIYVTINSKLYSFSKTGSFRTFIEVADTVTEEIIGIIRIPFLSALNPYVKIEFTDGEVMIWEADNFFSLHWKWKREEEKLVEAIDNLAGVRNSGVIGIQEYKTGTDLLIITGFLLSLLRRSKLSMGVRGLKRKAIKL